MPYADPKKALAYKISRRAQQREYMREHLKIPSVMAARIEYLKRTREKRNAHGREVFWKNRERERERARQKYYKNHEKTKLEKRIYAANYRIANKEKIRCQRQSRAIKDRQKYLTNKLHYHNIRRSRKIGSSIGREDLIKIFMSRIQKKKCFICYFCNKKTPRSELHFDHIIPLAKQGTHSVENICASCSTCNLSKGSKLLAEWNRLPQIMLNL